MYCILFLYQYNEDNKREINSRTEAMNNRLGNGDPAKKSAQRAEHGGQTNGSI